MHEASLAQAALDLAVNAARENGASRVTAVNLAVGAMVEADAETLAFWVGILAEGGPAEGAAVRVDEVPARAECASCGLKFDVAPPRWSLQCSSCGGAGVLRSGRELSVTSVEVE